MIYSHSVSGVVSDTARYESFALPFTMHYPGSQDYVDSRSEIKVGLYDLNYFFAHERGFHSRFSVIGGLNIYMCVCVYMCV